MDAVTAAVPGAGPPEGVRWAPGRAESAAAAPGALGSRGARSGPGPRRAEDAVWLQRELGGRQQAGASRGVWASASGPGPWTVTHLQEQGVVGREGCPLFNRRKLFRASLAHTLGERVMSKTWHWVLYGAQCD